MDLDLKKIEDLAFFATFGLYMLGSILYLVYLVSKQDNVAKLGLIATIVGFITNTMVLVLRTYLSGRAPFSNSFEFLVSFSWGIVASYLFAEWKYKIKALGAFVIPVAWLLLAFIIMKEQDRNIVDLPPALQSKWLTLHVITAMISYGAFAVSFGLSLIYLFKEYLVSIGSRTGLVKMVPDLETLDEMSYRFIAFSFPLLSIVIISGALWANFAWGRYWSWDPKETWSLITWLVYAAYMHARLTYGWKGRKAAIMSVIGFAAVLFTYFGVNFWLTGLHSYGGQG